MQYTRHAATLDEMSKESTPKKPETPLCIRFKTGELAYVHKAAARANQTRSEWVRENVFKRVERVLDGLKVEVLQYETAHGNGEQICIRFRPDEYTRVRRAAAKENAAVSPWIRACVMKEIGRDARAPKSPRVTGTKTNGESKTKKAANGAGTGSRASNVVSKADKKDRQGSHVG